MGQASQKSASLGRKLGLVAAIAIGLCSTIGAGIFSTIGEVAALCGSSLILVLAFGLGGLTQIPISLCYSELATAYPEDGSQYIYLRRAGSKVLAFFCGWIAIFAADGLSVVIMALAFNNYLGMLFVIPPFVTKLITCAVIITFTTIHIMSVENGGILQIILAVIKVAPFLLLIGFGAFFINPDLFLSSQMSGLVPSEANNIDAIVMLIVGIAATTFPFDGLNAACFISGEIKNPGKTLPRAIIITTIIVAVIYVCLSGICTGFLTIDEIVQSNAVIALVASKLPIIGDYAWIIICVVGLCVIAGAISSCLMTHARMPYAMAVDSMFFKSFGKVHKKYQTPYFSIGFLGAYTVLLFLLFDVSTLFKYFTLLALIKNALSIGTIFVLRKKPSYKPIYKCPGGYTMPLISIVLSVFLVINFFLSSPLESLIGTGIMLLTAIPAYIFITKKYNNSSQN